MNCKIVKSETTAADDGGRKRFPCSLLVPYDWRPDRYWNDYAENVSPYLRPVLMLLGTALSASMQLLNRGWKVDKAPSLDDMYERFDETYDANAERIELPAGLTLKAARDQGHAMVRGLYEKPHLRGFVAAVEYRFTALSALPTTIGLYGIPGRGPINDRMVRLMGLDRRGVNRKEEDPR